MATEDRGASPNAFSIFRSVGMLERTPVFKPIGFHMHKNIFAVFLVTTLALSACVSVAPTSDAPASTKEQLLLSASKRLEAGDAAGAIDKYLNKLVAECEQVDTDKDKQVFTARSSSETLAYLFKAASEKKNATVTPDQTCANGFYTMGFAKIELHAMVEAEKYIDRALHMSPGNSQYLSEKGFLAQQRKDWKAAIDIYTKAEDAATAFSPDNVKIRELTRAKRGIGFALVELGDHANAIKKYEECLTLDPDDSRAKAEIDYINGLKKK